MAVQLSYSFLAKIQETLASGVDGATSPIINFDSFDESATLTDSTTVPVTKSVCKIVALSGGALTIDLTTITGTNGLAQDMSGLKVQYVRIKNLGANTMTFQKGASNGYNLAGTDWYADLAQNQIFCFFGNDAAPDVGGSAKTIDITGTGAQTFELTIVAG